ncbi:MAG: primosomal protein N' [Candidatus Omnitrophica bacterium]|nr:primosomal protein N' [Candidatus Omnitrophota bacterium]
MNLISTEIDLCADVAVPVPVKDPFSYRVPPELAEKAKLGVRVRIPFRNRELIGYIVNLRDLSLTPEGKGPGEGKNSIKLKSILEILDEKPVISEALLAMTRWISEYYSSSWGESIENALPKWVKYGKKAEKALAKEKIEADEEVLHRDPDFDLTQDQTRAMEKIRTSMKEPNPKPILLYGVTGSGKSEIYIRTLKDTLKAGQTAICLVPEIALTEQLKRFFLQHFGNHLEILHSKMGDSERFLAWSRLEQGRKRIVLGPRSAIFAPLKNLGLILIDEEHEGSYKQETNPRYHAREAAMWRARHEKALLIMGSATPSLETMHRTLKDEVDRVDLAARINDKAMPKVEIIDLKNSPGAGGRRSGILSLRLVNEIDLNLKKKEGTLLLLNRRGFSTHINCPKCGNIENCISCQVTLTFHQEDGKLLCHYCNYEKPVPQSCGNCGSLLLKFAGFGTEKVESEIAAKFPGAKISRMDADTVQKKGSHEVILKQFRDREIDILIGTQMIAKGFDFPHVTLVGVVLADVGLMLPDFRSAERTFQLLTQVAGRAGRGKLPGRVLIQTFSPDHPSVRFAKDHDYLSFFNHEVNERYQYRYPPYQRLMNIIIRSKEEKKAYQYALELRNTLKQTLLTPEMFGSDPGNSIEIIGPAPLPFYRLRGHFRWHVMLKFPRHVSLTSKVVEGLAKIKKSSAVAIAIDVDPLSIL